MVVSAAMSATNDGTGAAALRGPRVKSNSRRAPLTRILTLALLVWLGCIGGDAAAPSTTKDARQKAKEPVIEEVNAKQLERLLNEKDFVAVYWCKCCAGYASRPEVGEKMAAGAFRIAAFGDAEKNTLALGDVARNARHRNGGGGGKLMRKIYATRGMFGNIVAELRGILVIGR